ncbi:MAG: AlpA family phage regulatory protein [Thiothrix sp.]|nr:AlpA family phage regulatory protein [Thiothrix sp.]HPQ96920.1 AlpA family phage regulatory protein [Thiolinea sp.]
MDKFLKLREVIEISGISSSEIYRKMHTGTFPSQYKINEKCARWKMSEIQNWIDVQRPKQTGGKV